MNSKLTPEQIQLLKDELSTDLVVLLMNEYHLSTQEAIDTLYTSETFERLQDNNTGLYYPSPKYVYSFLQNELSAGVVS